MNTQLAVSILVVMIISFGNLRASGPESHDASEQICGPRCINRVLTHYGRPSEDLLNLVKEIQGDPLQGSTFQDLEIALKKREINCRLVRLGRFSALNWSEPAVLLIDRNHFVVAETDGNAQFGLWLGLLGTQRMNWWQLYQRMSSTVLLTSAEPIGPDVSCVSLQPLWVALILSSCGAGMATILLARSKCVQAITKVELLLGLRQPILSVAKDREL